MTPMPRYRCHKEVNALKIADIQRYLMGVLGNGALIIPAEAGYASFVVDQAYLERHRPQVGGYYVVYADGYASFSPAAPFEAGYTRL